MTNVKTNNNGQFKFKKKLPFRSFMIPYTMFWKSNGPQIHPKKTLLNSVQKKTCDKTIINMKIIQLAAKQGGRKKLNII